MNNNIFSPHVISEILDFFEDKIKGRDTILDNLNAKSFQRLFTFLSRCKEYIPDEDDNVDFPWIYAKKEIIFEYPFEDIGYPVYEQGGDDNPQTVIDFSKEDNRFRLTYQTYPDCNFEEYVLLKIENYDQLIELLHTFKRNKGYNYVEKPYFQ